MFIFTNILPIVFWVGCKKTRVWTRQKRSGFLLFRNLLFEIMAWIWAWVQSKHLILLRSRHFSKEDSYFPATSRRIKISIIVNFLLTDSLSRL